MTISNKARMRSVLTALPSYEAFPDAGIFGKMFEAELENSHSPALNGKPPLFIVEAGFEMWAPDFSPYEVLWMSKRQFRRWRGRQKARNRQAARS